MEGGWCYGLVDKATTCDAGILCGYQFVTLLVHLGVASLGSEPANTSSLCVSPFLCNFQLKINNFLKHMKKKVRLRNLR